MESDFEEMSYHLKLDIEKLLMIFASAGVNDWFEYKNKRYTVVETSHRGDFKQLILSCGKDDFVVNYHKNKAISPILRKIHK